jgi:hypothetical protein
MTKRAEVGSIYYLAGPMSGLPNYNYDTFDRAAGRLRGQGYEIVSPHELFPEENKANRGQLVPSWYMRRALNALMKCDAIIFLPGWKNSPGVRTELVVALSLDMPLYSYDPTFSTYPYEMP